MDQIRVRANIAVVEDRKILLTPHFLENGNVVWYLPGGKVEFLETTESAAVREFKEETGFDAEILKLLEVSELIEPQKPWHSISISYLGKITGGQLKVEKNKNYGEKHPKWFLKEGLLSLSYRPKEPIDEVISESL